jgi:hypothetical protein
MTVVGSHENYIKRFSYKIFVAANFFVIVFRPSGSNYMLLFVFNPLCLCLLSSPI